MRTNRLMGRDVAFATKDDLRAWQALPQITALTPAGMHCVLVHTAQFIKWTVANEHRLDDPTNVLVRPRNVHTSIPRPMSDADVGLALLSAEQPVRAWIALEAFCGLRCMEVAKLARTDVRDNQSPAVLDILGKGGKRRVVPLPARVLDELHAAGMPSRGYLWGRMDGQPGQPSATRVSERINKHLHAQGITGTAHALRHRYGTMLYRQTRDIALVASVMGHSSTDTTRMYVLVDPFDAAPHIEAISRLAGEL